MAFWSTDLGAQGNNFGDPKRKFRFKVYLGGGGDADFIWWAKTVDKPSFEVGSVEHKFLNHTFNFPGSVTWKEVNLTLVDPSGDKDAVAHLSRIARNAGYVVPSTSTSSLISISKNSMVDSLGQIRIQQIDAEGDVTEEWLLKNPIMTECSFGSLAYGDDELVEVTTGFKYDWAECTIGGVEHYLPDGAKFS
jgi:hypothetical protein